MNVRFATSATRKAAAQKEIARKRHDILFSVSVSGILVSYAIVSKIRPDDFAAQTGAVRLSRRLGLFDATMLVMGGIG